MKIPEHTIDSIREATDIVSVVAGYLSLKKTGKNYKALCPFHTEKTASFTVSPDKQIFYCFGCGAGGNVFSFLMRYEKITFIEAVQKLAAETGIELPKYKEKEQESSEFEKLYRAHQFACNFFKSNLDKQSSNIGKYFKERSLSPDTLKHFQIGYIQDVWDMLYQEIISKKMDTTVFLNSGLLLRSEKDSSKIYDRFRNRILFPIHNLSGRVVAFGGRTLSSEVNIPKYINSPESAIYNKSQILYGLYFAKDWIRQEEFAILVEGYMDFLQLFQNGIKNVVATSGTSLTAGHARILQRYTKNVILCYDADEAGINAALRGGQILFQENLDTKILILPENEDPDSYVRNKGKSSFYGLIKTAVDYFDFKLERLSNLIGSEGISEQTRIVNELLDSLSPHKDPLKQNFYIHVLAEKYSLQENILIEELRKKRKIVDSRTKEFAQKEANSNGPLKTNSIAFTGAWSAERDILIILLKYLSKVQNVIFDLLDEEDFLNEGFKNVFILIKDKREKASDDLIHSIIPNISDDRIVSILTADLFKDIEQPDRYLNDCIRKVKISRYQNQIDQLRKKLQTYQPTTKEFKQILEQVNENLIHIQEIQRIFTAK